VRCDVVWCDVCLCVMSDKLNKIFSIEMISLCTIDFYSFFLIFCYLNSSPPLLLFLLLLPLFFFFFFLFFLTLTIGSMRICDPVLPLTFFPPFPLLKFNLFPFPFSSYNYTSSSSFSFSCSFSLGRITVCTRHLSPR
jgi:hypothetical protein